MKRKKGKYTVDFFLAQESFIDWINGDESLGSFWNEWIDQHPEALEQFNSARFLASKIEVKEEEINPVWIDQIKNKIDFAIEEEDKLSSFGSSEIRNRDFNRTRWVYFAASITLVVFISIGLVYFSEQNVPSEETAFISKVAEKGQKLSFYLNDGTKVKLNSASSLSYYNFTDSTREVFLKGEAFFDVVKDSQRPFTVIANNVKTRVLGTSFNVNALPDEESVTVALLSGAVEIADENDRKLKLNPGQIAMSKKGTEPKLIDEDISKIIAWRDGIIMFDKAPMKEVIEDLSKWYGVEFDISGADPEDIRWRYTGSFDNENLHVILKSLSYVKQFKYEIKSDTIFIKY